MHRNAIKTCDAAAIRQGGTQFRLIAVAASANADMSAVDDAADDRPSGLRSFDEPCDEPTADDGRAATGDTAPASTPPGSGGLSQLETPEVAL